MKIHAAIATALAVAGSAGSAAADTRLEIGGFAGAHIFSDENEIGVDDLPTADSPESSIAFGVRVAYRLHPLLSIEGETAIAPTETRDNETPVTIYGLRAQALLRFRDARVRPFALLGAGALISSPRDQNVIRTDADLVAHGGVGLEVQIGDNWGLRGDARLLLPPSVANEFVTAEWELFVGLFKTFPSAAATPVTPTDAAADADGDGVPDATDRCPTEPEDLDGHQDEDGCPDPDDDGDGIPDAADACPREAENKNGVEDADGCPEIDRDGDGIAGAADQCPDEAEDRDGDRDEDGCPDLGPAGDRDGDGVEDGADRCPDEAETKNGFEDGDGCPDEVPAPLQKLTGAIEGISFEFGSATIAASSNPTLDEAARVLAEHPDVAVEIQGHTDNSGPRQHNVSLSQQRADAVKQGLVKRGIAESRLKAVGYGPDKPIADNATREGRIKNRRVEIVLVPERRPR
jgi:OOP family OmpA-OmpF porin